MMRNVSGFDNRITSVEDELHLFESSLDKIKNDVTGLDIRVTALEENVSLFNTSLDEVNNNVSEHSNITLPGGWVIIQVCKHDKYMEIRSLYRYVNMINTGCFFF